MNKKIIICIVVGILIVILEIIGWYFTHPKFDKSNPIIFEQQRDNDYVYIIYEDREYISYSTINPSKKEKYLGYIGSDKQDEIYTFKGN